MSSFARAHGIGFSTFRTWVVARRAVPSSSAATGFLEVVRPASAREGEVVGLRVTVAGVDLRFPVPPSPSWFASLLREMSRC